MEITSQLGHVSYRRIMARLSCNVRSSILRFSPALGGGHRILLLAATPAGFSIRGLVVASIGSGLRCAITFEIIASDRMLSEGFRGRMRRRDKRSRIEAKGRVKGVVAGVVGVLDHRRYYLFS